MNEKKLTLSIGIALLAATVAVATTHRVENGRGTSYWVTAHRGEGVTIEDGRSVHFTRDGRDYVIRDEKTIAAIREIVAPQVRLGKQQAQLGSEQAKIGAHQARLGAEQARRAAEEVAAALRDDEGETLARTRAAREADAAKVDGRQRELSEQQRALGRQQEELARRQRAIAGRVERDLSALLDRAVRDGVAVPE